MPKTKLSALLTLLVVFLSGSMVGVFAHRLYMVRGVNGPEAAMRPPRPSPEEVKRQKVEELRETLKLDKTQEAKVNQAYDDTRERVDQLERTRRQNMRAVNEDLRDRIRKVLTPDQLPIYENLLAKWDAERKQRMEKMKQQGPPPPPR